MAMFPSGPADAEAGRGDDGDFAFE